jgi:oxalate decarboxylase/phosphoglucose isomerase-like protein (cupin superfamily)
MHIDLKSALSHLPLPATPSWPQGVWDTTVVTHGTMSLIAFTPRGLDYQTTHPQDELYIVMRGSGTLLIEDTPYAIAYPPASVH